MKNIPSFNNRTEFIRPMNIPVDDFIYKGQKISEIEKTEPQKEVLKLSQQLILERMKELGVEPDNDFDISKVMYYFNDSMSNFYIGALDFVSIRNYAEANVVIAIHELLHSYSAEYRYKDPKVVKRNAEKYHKSVKSGFHTNYYKDGFDKKPTSVNFSNINEAITEKITQQIFLKNERKIKNLKPLFDGRYEEKLQDLKSKHLKKCNDEIEKYKKQERENIKKAKQRYLEDVEDLKKEFEKIGKRINEEQKNKLLGMRRSSYDRFVEMEKKKTKEFSNMQLDLFNSEKEELKVNYSFEADMSAYSDYIEILDLMIEGVAINRSEYKDGIENNKQIFWKELQKAYFTGNTMFLRIFDKIYDAPVLKRFDNLARISNDEELEQIKNFLEKKNQLLRETKNKK